MLRRQRNTRTVLGEVVDVDLAGRSVTSRVLDEETVLPYDSLVVAAGSAQSYFGHDEFAVHAPGLKSIDDALEVRGRIFGAFEMAELEQDPDRREAWLTFALVGELAGALRDLSRNLADQRTRQAAADRALDVARGLSHDDRAPSSLAAAITAARMVTTDVMVFAGVDPRDAEDAVREGTGEFHVPAPVRPTRSPFTWDR